MPLEVHHRPLFASLYHWVARTVWAQALAVPEMLCVRGDVTCNIVTILNFYLRRNGKGNIRIGCDINCLFFLWESFKGVLYLVKNIHIFM